MDHAKDILTDDEIKAAMRELFKRAQTDWNFRELCLNDPPAAIRQITGKSLPDGVDLQFRDSDASAQ